jgi:hypothetical protein
MIVYRRSAWSLVVVVGAFASRAAASPSPDEASAKKLRDQAIYEDYLATNFAEAQKKLLRAISICDSVPGCAAPLRARLHCDLGVVDFALLKRDEGRVQFGAALDEDAGVSLEPDVQTPEVQIAFAEVKNARPPDAARPTPEPPPGAVAEPKPTPKAERKGARTTEPKDDAERSSSDETEASDCPPGFPGCHATGAPVEADSTPTEPTAFKTNWLHVGLEQDLMVVDSKTDVCGGGTGYTCFDSSGTYYAATPYPRAGDALNGGLTTATMRAVLGYDRALNANLSVGGRVGFALGGGPARPNAAAFVPLHIEARGTYWFGRNALAHRGLRFFVLAATGVAQVDAAMPVNVYDSLDAYRSGQAQHYKAWHKAGLGFGAIGGGAMVAFTPSSGLLLDLKVMEMFPTPGTVVGIQVGYAVGL